MQKKLTINLPESPEALRYLLKVLQKMGLISDKKAHSIEKEELNSQPQPIPKSRWTHAAERLQQEGFLKGQEDEVKNLTRDFRENFNI
jgi:hypothetical protein